MKNFRISICILGVLFVATLLSAQLQVSYTEYSVHARGWDGGGILQPCLSPRGRMARCGLPRTSLTFPGRTA